MARRDSALIYTAAYARRFHLAIPAGDLDKSIEFYCNILGRTTGNSVEGFWCDIDFWGNEPTLHATDPNIKEIGERHNVDMETVAVPHFGIHLPLEEFKELKDSLLSNGQVKIVDQPYVRFRGRDLEQETMFIEDPNGNVIELKTMVNPDALFHDDEEESR